MQTTPATIELDEDNQYLYFTVGTRLIGVPFSITAAPESAREAVDRLVGAMRGLDKVTTT